VEVKMKLNMNVEELRREILEGARAVPLCKQEQKELVSERSEKKCYVGRECEVGAVEDGEWKDESSYTKVDDVAAEGEVVGEVSLEEVSLETGMLGWFTYPDP
jgi:hypothetical protein